jgi:alpha-L-fucosidase
VLPPQDVARLGQFGASIRNLFTTNLAAGKPATADSAYAGQAYGAASALDGNRDTFWAAAAGQTSGRLEVDLGTPAMVRIVDVSEPIALGERASRYHVEIQEPVSDAWTTVANGTVIGWRNLIRLNPPRMAGKVALVIEQAHGVPAIAEFGLY